MKHRVVPRPHRIVPPRPEAILDSSSFDDIPPHFLRDAFEANYRTVLPKLLQITASQLATDKALENLEHAVQTVGEAALVTPENTATIEVAHVVAYRYTVLAQALSHTVPRDELHATTMKFMEVNGVQGTDNTLRKVMQKLKESVEGAVKNGARPSALGEQAPDDNAPFGVVATRAQSRSARTAPARRGRSEPK